MAVLKQSEKWPVHSVRDLHSRAQLSYLWQFSLPGVDEVTDRDLVFLAQRVGIPGIDVERVRYDVGGEENYTLGRFKRGGIVTASFIEVEGGKVDQFFRDWFDEADLLVAGVVTRARASKSGYRRMARLEISKRDASVSFSFRLTRLLPLSVGRYEFTYEGSGAMIIPVQMVCDRVERTE